MSDEVIFEGKSYVSSKRAADLSGYAQDYIGQLARSGQIEARRVGGLWYILPNSLNAYKENADQYVSTPPQQDYRAADMESSVSFEGKDYISSVRAAKLTGYNQDYIGQLARSQKVISRQVGNRWYVDQESLFAHKKEKDGLLGAVQADSVGLAKQEPFEVPHKQASHNDELFFNYISDSAELIPTISAKYDQEEPDMPNKHLLDLHIYGNAVPINKLSRPAPLAVQAHPARPPVPPEHKRPHRKQSSSVVKTAAAGVLTIVIVLSVAYTGLRDPQIYAVAAKSIPGKSTGAQLSASAAQAFTRVGDVLENWFVPKLTYKRQD